MALVVKERVRDTSITTGTGTITVSGTAPTRYRTLSAALAVNDTFPYAIVHQSLVEWEVGLGTYSAANQFTRTTVYSSSNAGAAVTFSAGTKDVFIAAPGTPGVLLNLELGHPTDTTVARASAGDISVEGNIVYRAGGTDVAIADGGTGQSTAAAAFTALKQAATTSATGVLEIGLTSEYLANTPTGLALTNDQVNAAGALLPLTDGATIPWDMALGFNASVTLGGNRTLSNPTNPIAGRTGMLRVTQGSGGQTLAYGTNWKAAGGSGGLPVLSTGAGAVDYIFYIVDSATSIVITGIIRAVA
jgi:hypothetical protein